jgi:hypothetical protein
LEREEESARDSEGKNREQQSRKREAKQTGVTVGKTCNRQRSVEHILMQGEVYLGRGRRKGSIREQSRKRERTDWNESRHRSHGKILLDREEESADRVKAATESKPGSGKQSSQGNGLKDMKVAEKCCGHMLMQGEVYLGRGRKGNIREQSRKRERTD